MAWSHLQAAGTNSAAAASIGVAYSTTNLSSGSKLVAWVALNSSAAAPSTTSISDGTNAFAKIGDSGAQSGNGTNINLSLWVLDTPGGDVGTKPTITAQCANTSTSAGLAICIQEVSGLATGSTAAACLDGGAAVFKVSTTGTSDAFPTYSSTAASEYLEQCYSDWGSNATVTISSGYSALDGSNANGNAICVVGDKSSTNGSETGTWTPPGGTITILMGTACFLLSGGSTFVAPEATFVGQGSTPHALAGVANAPMVGNAVRRSGYF